MELIESAVVTTLAGSKAGYTEADGIGSSAQFPGPVGIALDTSNNLYVSDYMTAKVRMVSASGVVTTLAGCVSGYADGAGTNAMFHLWGIAVDTNGHVIVADQNNNRIRTIVIGKHGR